jgi:hydrogenase/urease accessory protein HupE
MILIAVRFMLFAALLLTSRGSSAHEVRPAFLDLSETTPNLFVMTWKVPALGEYRLSIRPRLPAACHIVGELTSMRAGGAYIEHGRLGCDLELAGQTIAVDGLDATMTDVLVRIQTADGTVRNARLTPSSPSFTVPAHATLLTVFSTFVGLGVEHILFGVDHLLFVLGLLLLVRDGWMLVKTITSFTLAHSITLAAATLGYIDVPVPPLNAAIALSILFLGVEVVRSWYGETSLACRRPWLVAFAFGLLHGLGFASGLLSLGLPRGDIPGALLFFNIGVETGQLVFVAGLLMLARTFRLLEIRWPRAVAALPAYAVGTLGAYWTIDRMITVLGGIG